MLMRNPGPVKAHSFRRLNAPCGGEWNEGPWVGTAGLGQHPVDTFPGSEAQAGQPCPRFPIPGAITWRVSGAHGWEGLRICWVMADQLSGWVNSAVYT